MFMCGLEVRAQCLSHVVRELLLESYPASRIRALLWSLPASCLDGRVVASDFASALREAAMGSGGQERYRIWTCRRSYRPRSSVDEDWWRRRDGRRRSRAGGASGKARGCPRRR